MHIDLKFLRSWNAYNAGEVARFGPDIGETLVAKGIAQPLVPAPAAPAPAAPAPAAKPQQQGK